MSDTSIQWTDKVWNPIRGCSLVSPGCTNCYAMKQAHRFSGPDGAYAGLTKMTSHGPVWTGEARAVPDMLDAPLRWKKPQRVFVNSMSDLFHEDVPDEFIDQVFAVMALCPQHTFQVLTKRPLRMLRYCRSDDSANLEYEPDLDGEATRDAFIEGAAQAMYAKLHPGDDPSMWLAVHQPLPNVWLGVSVEDQQRADERIPLLLQTPAAVRFLSCEPLLEAITLDRMQEVGGAMVLDALRGETMGPFGPCEKLDWIIVGGESGPKARVFDRAWAYSIIEQCKAAGVAVFMKQLGSNSVRTHPDLPGGIISFHPIDRAGADPSEWPADLRVREFPR